MAKSLGLQLPLEFVEINGKRRFLWPITTSEGAAAAIWADGGSNEEVGDHLGVYGRELGGIRNKLSAHIKRLESCAPGQDRYNYLQKWAKMGVAK